jgi:glycosyltransferase involved in cell wall biosynthesis
MVVDDFVAGGAFKVGERLALGLATAHRIVFACNWSPLNESARKGFAEVGVETVRLFAHAGEARRAIWDRDGAFSLIERTAPDKILFIDSSPRSSIATKDVAHALGIAFVSVINFVDRQTPSEFRRWNADVLRAANAAHVNVFVSAAAKSDFEANFPLAVAPRVVVTNGVPDEFFRRAEPAAREAKRRELGIAVDDVMLLLAGRLEPRKGQHLALSALAAVLQRAQAPPLRLVLAGHGDEYETRKLMDQIAALGLGDQILYLGPRDDMAPLLDACDIVLMPSEQEADGLVSKEAMAKGRPVVATDLMAVREQGHSDALLVPAPEGSSRRTLEALVDAIDDLRRNPKKGVEMGRDLREIAERRFTMAQMVGAYSRILDDLPPRARSQVSTQSIRAIADGRALNFLDPGSFSRVFKDGWADVDGEGIWSLGARSRIAFELERPARKIEITLELLASAVPGHEQTFLVVANTRRVASWTFSASKRVTKTIRVVLTVPRRRFVLRLCHANAMSPFDLGVNDDRRPLGLHVFSLRVDAVADARHIRNRLLINGFRRVKNLLRWRIAGAG